MNKKVLRGPRPSAECPNLLAAIETWPVSVLAARWGVSPDSLRRWANECRSPLWAEELAGRLLTEAEANSRAAAPQPEPDAVLVIACPPDKIATVSDVLRALTGNDPKRVL